MRFLASGAVLPFLTLFSAFLLPPCARALEILRPREGEAVPANVRYNVTWSTNGTEPADAYFSIISESGDTNGRWHEQVSEGNFSFIPSFADRYSPDTREKGAIVRLVVVGRLEPDGERQLLAQTQFSINGTSWQNALMPYSDWTLTSASPQASPHRSSEEQARLLNAAAAPINLPSAGTVAAAAFVTLIFQLTSL